MGKASRTKVDVSRREKIAAQRAAAKRSEQRKRIFIAGGSILVVVAVVLAFVLVKVNSHSSTSASSSSSASNGPTGSALASVVTKVTSVPASTLNSVGSGSGSVTGTPIHISGASGPTLTSGGHPEMLYIGAEYCPYCAAERWAMIVALSRFGTFTGLATVHSASVDGGGNSEPYPDTPTWTFVNAKYTSKYLTFTPVEQFTNIPDKSTGGYTTLENMTSAQEKLLAKYDASPYVSSDDAGAIPFIDFGNQNLIVGASYNPGVLTGLSWSTIGSDLSNPSSTVAKSVDGTANYITAAICKMTGNQPASACTSTVQALESKL